MFTCKEKLPDFTLLLHCVKVISRSHEKIGIVEVMLEHDVFFRVALINTTTKLTRYIRTCIAVDNIGT